MSRCSKWSSTSAWRGSSHAQSHVIIAQLVAETFNCARVVIDATGLGAAPAEFLKRKLGDAARRAIRLHPAHQSRLGYNLLAFAGTGRLKLYQPIDEEQQRHHGRLQRELETARYELKGMEQLSFFVPTKEGHDDYLMSLALCARAAATTPPPPESRVIPPEEEYQPHQASDGTRYGSQAGISYCATRTSGKEGEHSMKTILHEIEPVAGCRQFQLRGDHGQVHGYISQVITPNTAASLQI